MGLQAKKLAFWILGETSPQLNWVDSVAGLNTVQNTNFAGAPVQSQPGVCIGTAAFFHPGQFDSSLRRTTTGDLESGWVEWTGWVNIPGGVGQTSPLFCKCGVFPAPADYQLFLNGDGSIDWQVRKADNSGWVTASLGVQSVGWHFFDCYDTGTEVGVSFDRGAFVKTTYTGGRRVTSADFAMAINPGVGSFHFNSGKLSNVGAWSAQLTDSERDFLAGVGGGGCPPVWPFPPDTTCINFQAAFAREQSGSDESCNAYGGVTNLQLCNPISAGHYVIEANVADLNGAVAGDSVRLKIRRVWNDPLNTSLDPCSIVNVAVEYDVA